VSFQAVNELHCMTNISLADAVAVEPQQECLCPDQDGIDGSIIENRGI
jgi:hypothetical protein